MHFRGFSRTFRSGWSQWYLHTKYSMFVPGSMNLFDHGPKFTTMLFNSSSPNLNCSFPPANASAAISFLSLHSYIYQNAL